MFPFREIRQHKVESDVEKLVAEQRQADRDELGRDLQKNSNPAGSLRTIIHDYNYKGFPRTW